MSEGYPVIEHLVMRARRECRAAWPLVTAGLLAVIWTPTLGRGFFADDFSKVLTTWSEFFVNPFGLNARPLEMLTFAALPRQAFVQHATSFVIYAVCIWLMWRLCRRMQLSQWSTFTALSSFFHPAFLWSVTWIAVRSDLLVIAFLLMAVLATRTPVKLAMMALCSAAKVPYLFQNVVFSFQFARRGELLASGTSLLLILIFGVPGYVLHYVTAHEATAQSATLDNASIGLAIAVPLRLAKLLEGILYVFAPVPMFAAVSWGPIVALCAYGALWYVVARSLRPSGAVSATNRWIPAMALTMCLPFVFASDVRVTGEATVLAFLAIASAAQWQLPGKIAIVGILVLNLTGIMLNYGLSRSAQYDVRAEEVDMNTSQPVYAYYGWREHVRQRILTVLGVDLPERTFN